LHICLTYWTFCGIWVEFAPTSAIPLFSVKRSWINNSYAAERIQRESIRIARNDHIRMSKDRQFQKLIVIRIATGAQITNDRHGFRGAEIGLITIA